MLTTTHYKLLVSLAVLLISGNLQGQNLFDSLHTARYASFLYLSGNYRLAAEEFERLHFGAHYDDNQTLMLIKSYRLSGQPEFARRRLYSLHPQPELLSKNLFTELLTLETLAGHFKFVAESARSSSLISSQEKLFFESSVLMLGNNFSQANQLLTNASTLTHPALRSYLALSEEGVNMRTKSPVLSGMMSTVIPGTGKMYTGEWQDGLVSLIFVGTTAWQSYRGFNKYGTSSPYGWIMGALSAGFYAGNIYGSVKSANRYNVTKRNNINLRVQAVFNHHTR
jgi:hypothetical protein